MKFDSFGSWDWRTTLSLGLMTYVGNKHMSITLAVGPFMGTLEIYFAQG